MRRCLYCQQQTSSTDELCPDCGMPLPAPAEQQALRTQRRFIGFVIALAVFCAAMIVWLPRTIG